MPNGRKRQFSPYSRRLRFRRQLQLRREWTLHFRLRRRMAHRHFRHYRLRTVLYKQTK